MTREIINELPEILKMHCCGLSKASLDSTNRIAMTESKLEVINFDKIPNEYARGKGWAAIPKSNDALYISTDRQWFFIEFKNGSIDLKDLYRKIYDSIIMLLELEIIPDFGFVRENCHYILVYNSRKYGKLANSKSRDSFGEYIFKRANTEEKLFEIEKLNQYLFKETHTYTKELFEEKFVKIMEKQEKN
jgi:hypothetical protein